MSGREWFPTSGLSPLAAGDARHTPAVPLAGRTSDELLEELDGCDHGNAEWFSE